MDERLKKDIDFCILLDKMKTIKRQTLVIDSLERETDAEHSYHVAMMALILEKYSDIKVDRDKVVRMLLIHDIVEIIAGDTPAYNYEANESKEKRELEAIEKIYENLEPELESEFKSLWFEFEKMDTPESLFANSIDRLQPILNNYMTNGGTWKTFPVTRKDIMKRIAPIEKASQKLWDAILEIVEDSIARGLLKDDEVENA